MRSFFVHYMARTKGHQETKKEREERMKREKEATQQPKKEEKKEEKKEVKEEDDFFRKRLEDFKSLEEFQQALRKFQRLCNYTRRSRGGYGGMGIPRWYSVIERLKK